MGVWGGSIKQFNINKADWSVYLVADKLLQLHSNVAYFRPLKIKWRQALLHWKNSQQGRKLPTLPKEQFPTILKAALGDTNDTQINLSNGFIKTGIYPQNVKEPLSRLPNQDRIIDLNVISDAFMQNLTQIRSNDTQTQKNQVKKKKLDVPAGPSIHAEDILDRKEAGPSGNSHSSSKKKGMKIRQNIVRKSSSTDSSDTYISLASSAEDLITAQDQSDNSEDFLPLASTTLTSDSKTGPLDCDAMKEDKGKENLPLEKKIKTCTDGDNVVDHISLLEHVQAISQSHNVGEEAVIEGKHVYGNKNYCVGDHVLVSWESQIYPGKIISMSEEAVLVSCMKKGKFWKWPVIKDVQLYCWEDVIKKINVPKIVKNGLFTVPEIDNV
ncbi:hypothetical protein ACJJTC_009381 [Scirpophaga incertulas]